RIFVDLIDTENALGIKSFAVDEGVLRSIKAVQSGNRTRVVINLTGPVGYETAIEGNNLLITLQRGEVRSTSNVTSHFVEAPLEAVPHSIRDVDFRRGVSGEGRVIVDLSDTTTGIDIRQQGSNIVVDFINAGLPRSLERRLDVIDFGTPVQSVDTYAQGNNVRIVIEPKGLWEHSAYQSDRQFIIDVKPIIEDPNKLVKGSSPGYSGEKLSLNFQNVEVRAVLQVIADFTGLNIVTTDTVTGSLTLRLRDVPWDQALDIILQSKGLAMRKTGNVVRIAPADELATKEKLELDAKQQISDLEPLHTESFQLNYQKADAFKTILSDDKQKILSKRGSAVVDPRTNTLFIKDTASSLEQIRSLINQIDVPVRQVMIEARIVIADDEFSRDLGVRLGYKDAGSLGRRTGLGVSGSLSQSPTLATGTAPSGGDDLNINLPVTSPAGSLAVTLLKLGTGPLLNLELSALEADNRGKVISSPRVITADQQKAVIEQGTEIGYLEASSSGAATVSFKPAVLSLAVTPHITPDDKVIMNLEVKKDAVGDIIANIPSIDTQKVITQVLVDNGETAVLGGIYEQTQRRDVTKVPLLGDVPVIGNLFRNTHNEDSKTELLVFITPRILQESLKVR
ncbi:MAG: type IV pilus secretin PilQ, partial [Burkholderiales bacterium]